MKLPDGVERYLSEIEASSVVTPLEGDGPQTPFLYRADYFVPLDAASWEETSRAEGEVDRTPLDRRVRQTLQLDVACHSGLNGHPRTCWVEAPFGRGKSYYIKELRRSLAHRTAEGGLQFLPILIELKEFEPPAPMGDRFERAYREALTEELFKEARYLMNYALHLDPTTCAQVTDATSSMETLWLLDGMDELLARLPEKEWRPLISALCHPRTLRGQRRLITGRPEVLRFFGHASLPANVEQLQILPMTSEQVDEFLRKRGGAKLLSLLQYYRGLGENELAERSRLHDLGELSRTPISLAVLSEMESELEKMSDDGEGKPGNGGFDLVKLYDQYTLRNLEARQGSGQFFSDAATRQALLKQVAAYMFRQRTDVIDMNQASVRSHFRKALHNGLFDVKNQGSEDKLLLEGSFDQVWPRLRHEIETYCLLVRREGRRYAFAHRSFMEFQTAKLLREELGRSLRDTFRKDRLSNGVIAFLARMIEPDSLQEEMLIQWILSTKRTGNAGEFQRNGSLGGNALSLLLAPYKDRPVLKTSLDFGDTNLKDARFYGKSYEELASINFKGAHMVGTDAPAQLFVKNHISPPKVPRNPKHIRCVYPGKLNLLAGLGDGTIARADKLFCRDEIGARPVVKRLPFDKQDSYIRSFASCVVGGNLYVATNDNNTVSLLCLSSVHMALEWSWTIEDGLEPDVHRIGCGPVPGSQSKLRVAYGFPGEGPEARGVKLATIDLVTREIHTEASAHVHGSSVNSVMISPDGRRLLSAADDGAILVSTIGDNRCLRLFDEQLNTYGINEIATSPDGRYVVSADGDGMLIAWHLETPQAQQRPAWIEKIGNDSLFSVDWRPAPGSDCTLIATGGTGRNLDVICVSAQVGGRQLEIMARSQVRGAHQDTIRCVRINGSLVFTSAMDGTIKSREIKRSGPQGIRLRSVGTLEPVSILEPESENAVDAVVALEPLASPPKIPSVFLSYNSSDRDEVQAIREELDSGDLKIWLDCEQIGAGDPFEEKIELALKEAEFFCFFVGKSGLGPHQRREWGAVNARSVKFPDWITPVPIFMESASIEAEMPMMLQGLHYVDFRQGREQAIDTLRQLFRRKSGKLR